MSGHTPERPTGAGARSTDEILRLLRRNEAEIRARYAVRGLALFGSYVRGEATPGSDLDLLVEYEYPPTLFQFVRLQRHLEMLGIPVDLVMKWALKPAIGQAILAEVVPVELWLRSSRPHKDGFPSGSSRFSHTSKVYPTPREVIRYEDEDV